MKSLLDFKEMLKTGIPIKEKIERYEDILVEYDKKILKIEEKKNRTCCCEKGCSFCCKQLIIISNIEKEMLAHVINRMSFKERAWLWMSTTYAVKKLLEKGISPKTVKTGLSSFYQRMMQERYFGADIPCIFLKSDKSCSVYKDRPIACMTYKNYGEKGDCGKSPFVPGGITYNGIEVDIWQEMYKRGIDTDTDEYDRNGLGFHILPYAVFDILAPKRRLYDFLSRFIK